MAGRLGEHYGIKVYETSVGFKYIGPKMIETGAMMGGEESGGYGFGMHLPERDGVYADLLLLDLFLRERAAGRWPVSKALAHFHELAGPSFYRRIDVHVAQGRLPGRQGAPPRRPDQGAAGVAGRPAGRPDPDARHRRRLEVLRRRRLVDARPDERDGAARPGLHGGDVAGDPRRDGGRGRAPGPRGVTDGPTPSGGSRSPGATSASGRRPTSYVGKILFIAAGRRLSLQKHLVKDESFLVLRGRLRLHLEDPDGVVRTSDLGPGEHRHVAVGRIHRYEAIDEDVELVEVSTPELDDVVRHRGRLRPGGHERALSRSPIRAGRGARAPRSAAAAIWSVLADSGGDPDPRRV